MNRNTVLGWALTGSLIATVVAANLDSGPPTVAAVTRPVAAGAPRATAVAANADAEVERLSAVVARRIQDDGSEVFRVVAPPAPAAKTVAAAPAAPTAPPLPWKYVGRMQDGDDTVVLLSGGGKDHSVRRGDVIDGAYLVDEIGPGTIVFVYLPLKQKQRLSLGEEF